MIGGLQSLEQRNSTEMDQRCLLYLALSSPSLHTVSIETLVDRASQVAQNMGVGPRPGVH